MTVLSYTAVEMFSQCPQLYSYKYIDKYEPAYTSVDMAFGSAWHEAQRVFWLTRSGNKALEEIDNYQIAADQKTILYQLMRAYAVRYTNDTYKPILVEEKRRVELLGVEFDVVFDGLVETPQGELMLIEHKTTSTKSVHVGSTFYQRCQVSAQHALYTLAARALGYDVSCVMYDVTRRLIRPRHRETPEAKRKYRKSDGALYKGMYEQDETDAQYRDRIESDVLTEPDVFVRHFFEPTPDGLEAAERNLLAWIHAIKHSKFPKNAPGGCHKYRDVCPFWTVCFEGNTLYDKSLFKERVRK